MPPPGYAPYAQPPPYGYMAPAGSGDAAAGYPAASAPPTPPQGYPGVPPSASEPPAKGMPAGYQK